jgi:hypothetical protein
MDGFTALYPADDLAKLISARCLVQCGRPTSRYPFGNPVSIEKTHLSILSSCPYLVADKSDGVRVCLVLHSDKSTRCAVLIDRKGLVFGLPVEADAVFFKGTVLDAELVRTRSGQYAILVFDVCTLAGYRDIEHQPLSERLSTLHGALGNISVNVPGWSIQTKPMFAVDATGAAALEAHVKTLPYATDGYILTPDNQPACQPGTAPQILKIKTCHTIDFMWNGGMLWFGDQKELFPVSNLSIQFDAQQLRPLRNGVIVEMSPQKGKDGVVAMLHFLQERQDKDTPNSYVTVHRTLQSIEDDVTLDAVVDSVMKNVM